MFSNIKIVLSDKHTVYLENQTEGWPSNFMFQRTCDGLAVVWPTMDLAEI